MKASAEIATLGQKQFDAYVRACAWCLAHAHARSGDPIAIAAYLGAGAAFDRRWARSRAAYADQTKADWKALNRGDRRRATSWPEAGHLTRQREGNSR